MQAKSEQFITVTSTLCDSKWIFQDTSILRHRTKLGDKLFTF
jgi:hypothetical protein